MPLAIGFPHRIVASEDESFVIVSDGQSIHRINTNTSSIAQTYVLGGNVIDVAITRAGIVAAVQTGPTSELHLRDPQNLTRAIVPPRPLMGLVEELVALDEQGSSAIALATFDDSTQVRLYGATLEEVMMARSLPEIPHHARVLTGKQRVVFSTLSEPSIFAIRVSDGDISPKMNLAAAGIEELFYNEALGILMIGTEEHTIIPWDVDHDRPLLQQVITVENEPSVIRADSMGRMFVLDEEKGRIDPLLP
jgi:hypothetical protein